MISCPKTAYCGSVRLAVTELVTESSPEVNDRKRVLLVMYVGHSPVADPGGWGMQSLPPPPYQPDDKKSGHNSCTNTEVTRKNRAILSV